MNQRKNPKRALTTSHNVMLLSKNLKTTLILLLLPLILMACGGGAGQTASSPTQTPAAVNATTSGRIFYIDYVNGNDANNGTSESTPWKHHPYMKGFGGSYTHQAGDTFVFKGGVTWAYSASDPIFPMIIQAGGASGALDTYTVDKNWYSGSSWTPPVFDGCQTAEGLNVCGMNGAATLGASSYLIGDNGTNNASHIIINGLQLQNIGDPIPAGGDGSGDGISFSASESDVEIKNCTFTTHSLEAFGYSDNWTGGPASKIYIHDNQISNAGRAVMYIFDGSTLNDVEVYNNKWQGPGSTLATIFTSKGWHLDGLMIGNPNKTTAITVNNVLFHGNYFYGDWENVTGQFFELDGLNDVSVYNNVFALEQTSSASGYGSQMGFVFLDSNNYGNQNFYNNTFSSDSLLGSTYGATCGIFIMSQSTAHPVNIAIENNIFSGVVRATDFTSGSAWTSLVINYNLYNLYGGYLEGIEGSWNYSSPSSACSGGGFDCNSLGGNSYSSSYPQFTMLSNGTVGSGNWMVQSGSPAIDAGANLSSIFTTDITGATRPATSSWTMGAYEYNTTSTSTSYTVTPSAGGGGTISPSTPQTVNYDGTTSFTVTPNTGYSISSVTGCGGTLSGNIYTTGPITSNCTVTATFAAPNTYTVTPSAGSGGTISPSTPQTVNYDGTTSFTVTPNSGYSISSVTGCGGTLSGSTYTTGPITSNCAVTASFAATATTTTTTTTTTYTLAVTDTGTGSGVVTSSPTGISCGSNCSETVNSGTSVILTATPNSGSSFAGWSGGGCSGTGTCTIDLTSNTAVSAAFTANPPSTTSSITVTSPSGGQIWYTQSRYNIAWAYTGNPGSNVNIYLLKNGSVVRTIATGISVGSNGSGSYNWRIPKPIPHGSNYSIMVTSSSNSNYSGTSGTFSIQ